MRRLVLYPRFSKIWANGLGQGHRHGQEKKSGCQNAAPWLPNPSTEPHLHDSTHRHQCMQSERIFQDVLSLLAANGEKHGCMDVWMKRVYARRDRCPSARQPCCWRQYASGPVLDELLVILLCMMFVCDGNMSLSQLLFPLLGPPILSGCHAVLSFVLYSFIFLLSFSKHLQSDTYFPLKAGSDNHGLSFSDPLGPYETASLFTQSQHFAIILPLSERHTLFDASQSSGWLSI